MIYIGRLAPPKLLLEMLNAFKTLITEQAPPPLLQERGPGGEVERSSGGEEEKSPGDEVEKNPGGEVIRRPAIGYHFTLAGTGPLLPALQRTVVEMGLEHYVTFAGVLSKEQVRALICNSDAAILLKTIDDWTIYE